MGKKININEGLLEVIKSLLGNEEFVSAVLDLLLGREGASEELIHLFKRESYEHSLNEVVSIHRIFKTTLNEDILGLNGDKDKNLIKKIAEIPERSMEFQSKVIAKTLKKPGAVVALVKLIASKGTDVKSWTIIAPLVDDSAVEVTQEDDKEEVQTMLQEDNEASYGGRIPVNVYIGRFQPFHLGHLSCIQEAAKYGLRTVICPVMKGKSASAGEHPFDDRIEAEIFQRLKGAYEEIADVIPVKNSYVDSWIDEVRNRGFEPITWTTGEDRARAYQAMIEKNRERLELTPNFKVLVLDKNVDGEGGSLDNTKDISGTNVRRCLMNDDREGFMRQMPECLHDMYDEMRQAIAEPAPMISESFLNSICEDVMRRLRKLNE